MLKTMLSRAVILVIILPMLLCAAHAGMSLPKQIRYDITAVIGPTSEGFGVIHGASGTRVTDPVEPNAPGVLGIGVDTNNPRPFGSMREVWFGPAGNIDDRPQREISIHWNGREVANRFCDEDLQNPFGVHINVEIDHVPGGAEITITAGKHKIYDHFFVHGAVVSSAPRAAGDANVTLSPVNKSGKYSSVKGQHLVAIDKVVNDASRHTIRQKIQFPAAAANAGRVILTRTMVTGHGMSPNTGNAGEFYALWRRIEVGEQQWYDLLWKTDVYLNPVRPQGGTWKFSRAGWAPGSIAEAWTVDITSAVKVGSPVTVGYGLEPFVNKTPNEGFLAAHVIGSQAILFEKAK